MKLRCRQYYLPCTHAACCVPSNQQAVTWMSILFKRRERKGYVVNPFDDYIEHNEYYAYLHACGLAQLKNVNP